MRTPEPTREQVLLLDLLKGKVPATLDGMDSKILFELFRRHRLFPMAGPVVNLLKEEEKEPWKKAIQSRTIRSMQQLSVLGQINEILGNEGIPVISMKGPVLAHQLFGNLGARHSSDLDILVHPKDIRSIMEILGRKGFDLMYPIRDLSERQWSYYSRYKKDIGLFNKEQGLLLEVHYSIENYLGLSPGELDHFFQDPLQIAIGGREFTTMNHHRDFIYLSSHGAVHQYRRLFWIRDIAEAMTRWELDHRKILEDAKGMGIDRMIGLSAALAGELCNAELPEVYLDYLDKNRRAIEKMKAASYRMILGPEFPDYRGKLSHHFFMLRSKPQLKHYFRTAWEILNRRYIGKFLGGH